MKISNLIVVIFSFSFSIQAQEKKQNDTIKNRNQFKYQNHLCFRRNCSIITKEDLAFEEEVQCAI